MTGKPRGIAFVEFSSRAEAKKAIANPGECEGRTIECSFSGQKPTGDRDFGNKGGNFGNNNRGSYGNNNGNSGGYGGNSGGNSSSRSEHTVFVGNLGFKTNENSIRKFFSSVGNVLSVRIAKSEDGRSKGFCHVDLDSAEAVQKAKSLHDQDLDGRNVRVDASEPRKGGNDRGGFGGNDRRGGFGGRGGRGGNRGGIARPNNSVYGGAGKKVTFDDDE